MARYLGPKCRLSRKEGTEIPNKSGIRPLADKCKLEVPPGVHGLRRGRHTEYGTQLRMKQLIRRYYEVLEKQFRGYYKQADRQTGATGLNLLRILESRLDNVVYRMGFASTRAEARQLVSHKAILVNGQILNIPSYHVQIGDVIEIRSRAKGQLRIKAALELAESRAAVNWVSVDTSSMKGTFNNLPDAAELPQEFKVNLVVELYSK